MENDHFCYNALAIAHYGDYLQLSELLRQHGSWVAAYQAAPPIVRDASHEQRLQLEKHNVRLVLRDDAEFPPLLREMPWPPHGLYLRGAPIGTELKIAVVGTRKAGIAGISAARMLARDCAAAGVTIVSGLALGIDGAAHEGTLEVHGKAIAILAGGVECITPRTNARIGEQILATGGTIASEYPIGTIATKRLFIERNRIVSGLSSGVVVIEAPARSGTIATARFASDQNREIFVFPGAFNNPNYAGSHTLIRAGATLVTEAAHVLDALGLSHKKTHAQQLPFLDGNSQRIVELLSANESPLTADFIAERTSLGAAVINETLALLTIEGIVKESGGTYYM